eukprot:902451-Rhodomonas_salina.1
MAQGPGPTTPMPLAYPASTLSSCSTSRTIAYTATLLLSWTTSTPTAHPTSPAPRSFTSQHTLPQLLLLRSVRSSTLPQHTHVFCRAVLCLNHHAREQEIQKQGSPQPEEPWGRFTYDPPGDANQTTF